MTYASADRRTRPRPRWVGYVVTVIAELALTAGLWLLLPLFPLANFPVPYVLVMMAVTYLFGEGPAILAFVLGFIFYAYSFPPYHGIWPPASRLEDWTGLVAFLLGTAVVGIAASAIRKSGKRDEALAAELRQSEEKFRNLVENTSDWFWEVDSNCIYTYASPRIRDLLGYEPEDMVGKTPFEFMSEEEARHICDAFTAIAIEQKPFTLLENTLIHRDGHLIIVETSGVPILDDHGTLLGYRGTDRDITERKQAELALRESESRYRSLIETMNEGFATTDADYVFTYVNQRFAEMLGYAPDEVVGHHLLEYLDEDNRAIMRTEIAERRAGRRLHYQLTWTAKDGQRVYALISPSPILGSNGEFIGSFATLTDITDRKHAEEALRESEQRFRQLFQNANDAIFLLAISETGVPGNFVQVNDVACKRLGYSREELLTMGPKDIDTKETTENLPTIMKNVLKRGHGTFDVVQVCKHGLQIPTEISAHLFDLDGKQVLLSVGRDITERKQAEEKLRKSEERFRSLFERAADSFFLHDLNGRFIEVNQAACDYLGYTREELLNLCVSDIVTDFDQTILDGMWRSLIVNGPMTVIATHRRKDGSTLPVEGRLSTFEYRDQVMILAVVRDITERVRAEDERRALERHMEEQKRLFYRETLLSVTDGKLGICDERDVTPYLADSEIVWGVSDAAQVSIARHEVEEFCRAHGLEEDRLGLFMVGVGEAITNALKHGKQGNVYAGLCDDALWVGIEDNGPGIESLILPRAVLLRGFSTKPSLGLGYCVMLDVADKVLLKTDERGTLVILEKKLKEPITKLSIQNLPDTWDSIPS